MIGLLTQGSDVVHNNEFAINAILACVAVLTLVWSVFRDRRRADTEEVRSRTDYAEVGLEGMHSLVVELRTELQRSRDHADRLDRQSDSRQKILVKEIVRLRDELTLLRMLLEENGIKAPPPTPSLVPESIFGEFNGNSQ